MDQISGLCSKSIDIDSLSGGNSIVDETLDGIIETSEVLSDGDTNDSFDGNCREGRERTDKKMSFNRSVLQLARKHVYRFRT